MPSLVLLAPPSSTHATRLPATHSLPTCFSSDIFRCHLYSAPCLDHPVSQLSLSPPNPQQSCSHTPSPHTPQVLPVPHPLHLASGHIPSTLPLSCLSVLSSSNQSPQPWPWFSLSSCLSWVETDSAIHGYLYPQCLLPGTSFWLLLTSPAPDPAQNVDAFLLDWMPENACTPVLPPLGAFCAHAVLRVLPRALASGDPNANACSVVSSAVT